jgi:hypothetical protein
VALITQIILSGYAESHGLARHVCGGLARQNYGWLAQTTRLLFDEICKQRAELDSQYKM